MQPLVFFDGECAVCARSVRWISARDRGRFAFAPIGGDTFRHVLPEPVGRTLPDTLAVMTTDKRLLIRSAAVRYVLAGAVWPWPLLSRLMRLVPPALADAGYDFIARHRRRIVTTACEPPGPSLASRLLP